MQWLQGSTRTFYKEKTVEISYDTGDIFTFDSNGFGMVLDDGKALLISGGGRKGHEMAVAVIPDGASPLSQKVKAPFAIQLAFRAVQMVTKEK